MRELSPSGGSERYGVCDDEGRDDSARRLRVAKGAPTPVGPLCPLCRRRGGSQTRPSHLHPLVSVGRGLALPPVLCRTF